MNSKNRKLGVSDLIHAPLYSHEDYVPSIGERIGLWASHHLIARRIVSIAALFFGVTYLTWRVLFTNIDTPPLLFWTLFAAELFGLITFALFVHDSWQTSPLPVASPLDLSVAILIPTYDEPIDVVEPTVYAATLAKGRKEVFLLDDGNRVWAKELCVKYGVRYVTREEHSHAKAGNINSALKLVETDLILVLDADHVCHPEILNRMTGYFADHTVAIVQTLMIFEIMILPNTKIRA